MKFAIKSGQIIKDRRRTIDRREDKGGFDGTERRSGEDRRRLEEKLQNMLKVSRKEKAIKNQKRIESGTGSIIRRRKGQKDKRIT